MKKKLALLTSLIILLVGFFFLKKTKIAVPITTAKGEISNFSLLDNTGTFHELYRYADASAIVFISQGNDCPIIQKYIPTINSLKNKFEPSKVKFFLINSNRQDNRDSITKELNDYRSELPALMDKSQLVAELLGITRTSEAVIIDPKKWKIIYRGAISDQLDYGVNKEVAKNKYLENALMNFLQNKPLSAEVIPAKGCLITFSQPDLSYKKNISQIITNKCLKCHSENGRFPPVFNNHEKLKNWSAMIKETILTDRMPPGSMDIHYGEYKNNFQLTPDEKRALIKWIDNGTPLDDKNDPVSSFHLEKQKKENNLPLLYEASMTEDKTVPPEGEKEYQYFQLSGGPIPRDMWVRAIHVTSTNPRLLHHMCIMGTSQPLEFYNNYQRNNHPVDEKMRESKVDGDLPLYTKSSIFEYESARHAGRVPRMQAWAAGKAQPMFLPKGVASFFPKGSYLILESHYMGTGKVEKERTKIKFYGQYENDKNLKKFQTQTIVNTNFKIPPMVKDYVVETPTWKPKSNIHILGFIAHLHMRGTSAKIVATNEKGETRTIVSIPNFYYGWQTGTAIVPAEPIAIEGGKTTFKGICHYDNSPTNPNNPDPNKAISYGQRHDTSEMCHFHFNYVADK
jgi:hypothetical protein